MQLNKAANPEMKPLSRAKTMRVKPPAPQPPQPQVQPEAESRPRVLNRAKSSPNLLLGLDVTPEVSSSRASLLSDSLINLADGERPSKSRRKGSSINDVMQILHMIGPPPPFHATYQCYLSRFGGFYKVRMQIFRLF